MKRSYDYFCFLVVATILLMFSSCSTFHKNVFLSSGDEYITQCSSNGDYNIKGKSFYIEPADGTISNLQIKKHSANSKLKNVAETNGELLVGYVDFEKISKEFEKSLLYSGALKAKDAETADMRIVIDYGVIDESDIDTLYPQRYSTERRVMNSYSGESYTEYVQLPRYSMRKLSEYKRYINLRAYDNSNKDNPNVFWTMNLTSTGTSHDLEEIVPYMAYSSRHRYGKETPEIVSELVGESDYMYELYKNDFLAKENIIEWPVCKTSDKNFLVAFVAKFEKETIICIRKTGNDKGCYSFGPSMYLDANGGRYKGTITHCNYLLGEKIWNEMGTRYFLFSFPVNVIAESAVTMFEENSSGRKGKEWSEINISANL